MSYLLHRFLLGAIALMLIGACGSTPTVVQASPSPSPSPSPLACTISGGASASWPGPSSVPAAPAIVSATTAGDTFTLAFAIGHAAAQTVPGTPQFEIKQTSGTHFLKDPSGLPVDLAGSAGATITLRGFRGDVQNFAGPQSMISTGPLLLEVYEIGDFEGVITWAVGMSRAGCANVTTSGSTMTFRFIPPP